MMCKCKATYENYTKTLTHTQQRKQIREFRPSCDSITLPDWSMDTLTHSHLHLHSPNETMQFSDSRHLFHCCLWSIISSPANVYECFIYILIPFNWIETTFHLFRYSSWALSLSEALFQHWHVFVCAQASYSALNLCERVWDDIDLYKRISYSNHKRSICILSYFRHCSPYIERDGEWHKCEFHSTTPNFALLCTNEWQRWDSNSNDVFYVVVVCVDGRRRCLSRLFDFTSVSCRFFHSLWQMLFYLKCDEKWYRLPSCIQMSNDFVCFPITLPSHHRWFG